MVSTKTPGVSDAGSARWFSEERALGWKEIDRSTRDVVTSTAYYEKIYKILALPSISGSLQYHRAFQNDTAQPCVFRSPFQPLWQLSSHFPGILLHFLFKT